MANNEKVLCWLRKTWLSLRILVVTAGLFTTVVLAYAKLNGQVSSNKLVAEKAAQKADANEKALIRFEGKLDHLITGMDDIKEELKDARRGTPKTQ